MGTYDDSDESVDLDWELDDDDEAIGPSSTMPCTGEGSSSAGPSNSQLVSNFMGMGFSRDAVAKAIEENGEGNLNAILDSLTQAASSSASPSNSQLVSNFMGMEFSRDAVAKAIEENEGNFNAILDSLLTQAVLETSSPERERVLTDLSSETACNFRYDLSDSDSDWASEEKVDSLYAKDKTLKLLVSMGYSLDEAAIALDRCGPDASIMEVTDFISAAQMARSADALFDEDREVDTVAYHLSVLKDMFPNGISVLSLFSGIGGAEIALHRLGIPLKNVATVEISEASRNIFRSWWEQSNQKGNLIDDICDVKKLDRKRLGQLINLFGDFDLIIGGSPCNNLSGSNRYKRDGIQGEHSILFFDYVRILNTVKDIMARRS